MKIMEGVGLVLFFIGASAMDSESLLIPTIMTIGGLLIAAIVGTEMD